MGLTYIYCRQILTFLGLFSTLFSRECESPYVSSSQLALFPCECSLSEVSDSPLFEDIVEIAVKYNKNIRRVE